MKCFMLKPTGAERLSLRRYSGDKKCPGRYQYHNGEHHIGDLPEGHNTRTPDHSHAGWPKKCDYCDYQFEDADNWQLFNASIFIREDTKEIVLLNNAPEGAMWHADWLLPKGSVYFEALPEEVIKLGHLIVKCPGGCDWDIDSKSSNGDGWIRTGVPPNVTARPSIQTGNYHGWLTNGEFVSC